MTDDGVSVPRGDIIKSIFKIVAYVTAFSFAERFLGFVFLGFGFGYYARNGYRDPRGSHRHKQPENG